MVYGFFSKVESEQPTVTPLADNGIDTLVVARAHNTLKVLHCMYS